jgi:hypothetical protein
MNSFDDMGLVDLKALGLWRGSVKFILHDATGQTFELEVGDFRLDLGSTATLSMSRLNPDSLEEPIIGLGERMYMTLVMRDLEILPTNGDRLRFRMVK